ncbi:MAG: hypothetical protein ACYCWE_03985 [Eubacteriales bacterium]
MQNLKETLLQLMPEDALDGKCEKDLNIVSNQRKWVRTLQCFPKCGVLAITFR